MRLSAAMGARSDLTEAWSWYDSDLFLKLWVDAGTDRKVEQLNNYWQHLYRSALDSGLTQSDPAMQKLNADMGRWDEWQRAYKDAVFRRAFSFGFSDWDDELDGYWYKLFHEDVARVTTAAGEKVTAELEKRGVDPRVVEPETSILDQLEELAAGATEAAARGSRTAIFWPLTVMAVATVGAVWMVSRSGRPRYR